jgi:rubrerythrin
MFDLNYCKAHNPEKQEHEVTEPTVKLSINLELLSKELPQNMISPETLRQHAKNQLGSPFLAATFEQLAHYYELLINKSIEDTEDHHLMLKNGNGTIVFPFGGCGSCGRYWRSTTPNGPCPICCPLLNC